MPRQSDSAENKPGEKVMMRKLAVTAFALSLAALGCGSDSGTKPTPDTGVAIDSAKPDVVTTPTDTATPDLTIQVTPDTGTPDLAAVDAAIVPDVAQTVDQAPPIVDTAKSVDVQGIDGAKPVLDGGAADTQHPDTQRVDSGASVDAGSVDGSVG
jgi:hypothetical protein